MPSPGSFRVAIVVLNWNGHADTLPLLDSLAGMQGPAFCTVVVDNGSRPEERLALETGMAERGPVMRVEGQEVRPPERLTLLKSAENLGFAGGNNLAVAYLREAGWEGDFIWFLNNDTTVEPETLTRLVTAMEADETVGAAQSLLLRADDPDRIDSAGIRLRRRGGAFDEGAGAPAHRLSALGDASVSIFGGCAASVLLRRRVLDAIGAFDETFFAVNEDVDLACRLFVHGYRTVLVPGSVVFHRRGVSRKRKTGFMAYIAARNKARVMARWWPRGSILPLLWLELIRLFGRTRGVPGIGMKDWWAVVLETHRAWRNGPDNRTRRALLAAGTRTLLPD